MQRHLVISAVNFSEGGPLTILRESLDAAVATLGSGWTITALVHDCALISDSRIQTIEFPDSKQSWLRRLRLEWIDFGKISCELKADLWISLHDITPRVSARRQAVYCHNPSPFYRPTWREARFDPAFILFNKFYLHLYRRFIRRNHAVIVQQQWLREAFKRHTGHPNIVVAYPAPYPGNDVAPPPARAMTRLGLRLPTPSEPLRLLYPALPRVFKNIETLCEAVCRLSSHAARLVDLRLTLDGSENAYARDLVSRYRGVAGIRFLGRQNRTEMQQEYAASDMVLFPSRLETWGLPISEAKAFGKPLLVADLPYARETVGNYENVTFLPPNDIASWSKVIARASDGRWVPEGQVVERPADPFCENWPELWRLLTKDL